MENRRFIAWSCLAASALPAAKAQLTLNSIGGTIGAGNYATLSGTSAFGLDEIDAGRLSVHKIPQIRDGIYGNSNSWIGDSLNSYVGLNFGTTPLPVGRVAWGRDNTATFGDRTAGTYSVHYTQVANPGNSLTVTGDPLTGWATVGSVNYVFEGAVGSPISMSLRHEWSFATINATGIRLTAPGSSFANGAAIDELEAYGAGASPLSLVTTGGTMGVGNIALTSTPFAQDALNFNNGSAIIHTIPDINDGLYGNSDSWIGNSESSFVGLDFNGSFTVDRFAFGRDNTGTYGDRSGGTYLLQYTTVPDPGQTTANWTSIGAVYYDHNGLDSATRHEYSFAPVTATGLRLITAGNGIGSGVAIDEFEVYTVPEPSVAWMSLVALGIFRRRRSA